MTVSHVQLTSCVLEPFDFGKTIGPAVVYAPMIANPYGIELRFHGSLSFRSDRRGSARWRCRICIIGREMWVFRRCGDRKVVPWHGRVESSHADVDAQGLVGGLFQDGLGDTCVAIPNIRPEISGSLVPAILDC